jgi:hypothetical protein
VDPTAQITRPFTDKERLYELIVEEMQGSNRHAVPWPKGSVLLPRQNPQPVLVNEWVDGTYNPDQSDSDISEIRLAPGGAAETTSRYWDAISAIGAVGARHGLMAMILSTHVSAAVISENNRIAPQPIYLGLTQTP